MKRFILIVCIATITTTLSVPAYADWNVGDPNKWVQLPDLQDTGIDVSATLPFILADDWKCTETGPITGIHIWGSWLKDYLPMPAAGGPGNPADVTFRMAIYSDIPAEESPTGYSMPNSPIALQEWSFAPGTFDVRRYAVDVNEGWLYPPNDYTPAADTVVWQYNFSLDEPFLQEGTADEPVVYWLALSAIPNDDEAFFGWKTSIDHWNDDAVWLTGDVQEWQELRYNFAHPFEGDSMDLAFVLTPEPATVALLGFGSLTLLRKKRGV